MKGKAYLWSALLIGILYIAFIKTSEGFKNLDYEAQTELNKITTKILPYRATCIRGAQCISGKCLETNNETTYGYCAQPLV
jgi:hypothetical protein